QLVLIGDPKQAIYAFRGADVHAYLDAAGAASHRATLDVNWRSDQGLVDAYDALFGGARLGHEGIVYRRVRAAPAHRQPRLSGAPCAAPLRLRVLHRPHSGPGLTTEGWAPVKSARVLIAADLAADVVGLLSSRAEVIARDRAGAEIGRQPLHPGQVAVLVRTNRHAAVVRDALEASRVPAVINGAGSVLGERVARDWLSLLQALERPSSAGRAHAAALTPFLGWSAERVASASEDEWEDLHACLHRWAGLLRRRGVAALVETITVAEDLPARVLAGEGGERLLTDLRHIGHLLHRESATGGPGVSALAAWLRRHIAEAGTDTGAEERSRRLESDADAVQVLTIHRSKGLEFPVVYLPYLWDEGWSPEGVPVVFHDPQAGHRRTLDVGVRGPGFSANRRRATEEERGEDLRLAYVALTRACHQAVVWWAASWGSRRSPLGRLLFGRDAAGNVAPELPSPPDDSAAAARLEV
ncbi:MAG: 3'-5' exonuclease, partial [Acidimicrobiales bacterium]